jgi:hypothetical protein
MGIFNDSKDEWNNLEGEPEGPIDNEPLPKFIDMALALMENGITIDVKLLRDPKALKELYEEVVLGQKFNPTTSDENDIFQGIMQGLPDTPSDAILEAKNLFSRLMKIARQVDYKGAVDLADGIDRIITAQFETYQPDYETSELAVPQTATSPALPAQEEMLEPDPSLEDEDIEENIVAPKDIDDLVNKLEAVLDAQNDEFDPDLLPVTKKIIKELADKIEQVDTAPEEPVISDENPPSDQGGTDSFHEQLKAELGQSEQQVLPQTAVANILKSTVKLAHISEVLENTEFKNISQYINDLMLDIKRLIKTQKR